MTITDISNWKEIYGTPIFTNEKLLQRRIKNTEIAAVKNSQQKSIQKKYLCKKHSNKVFEFIKRFLGHMLYWKKDVPQRFYQY